MNPSNTSSTSNSATLAKRRKERQGPTDWTHLGLKSKHRDERNREEAWKDWKNSQSLSSTILYDIHEVVPIVKIERHPLHLWYNERLQFENENSNERTKSRLLMKRFVFDVQELWLANLEHLREHKASQIFSEDVSQEEKDDYQRGKGLKNRRDTKEITSMNHQIQAVSQKRAFANAYHTTRLPQVNLILDYVSFRTPSLPAHIPLPPIIRAVASQIRLEPDKGKKGLLSPTDGSSCSDVKSHCLNIERLIPSADYISFFGQDILWRFELIASTTLERKLYVCKEDDLVDYITVAILRSQSECNLWPIFQSSENNLTSKTIESVDGMSHWCLSRISISGKFSTIANSISKSVHIIFNIDVQNAEQSHQKEIFSLQMQLSILELQTIVVQECGTTFPKFPDNISAIEDSFGSIPWITLVCKMKVTCDGKNRPIGLSFDELDSVLRNIDGALSNLQARGCAYELLHLLRFSKANCTVTAPVIDGAKLNLVDVTRQHEEKKNVYNLMCREAFLEDKQALGKAALYYGLWEQLLEYSTCLSMHANALNYMTQDVPGSCEMGRKGLWFADDLDPSREKTQVAAKFFRDATKSSTDTIFANMTLALETSILFKPVVAWENFSHSPAPYPVEECRAISTLATQFSWNNLIQGLRSPIEHRVSNTIIIFGAFPVEGVDYLPRDTMHPPPGFKRFVPTQNQYGFREQLEVKLLSLDAHVDSHVYGITRSGAVANNLGVNSRNIWHNVIAISEHINR
jgi:hypothetical protein